MTCLSHDSLILDLLYGGCHAYNSIILMAKSTTSKDGKTRSLLNKVGMDCGEKPK